MRIWYEFKRLIGKPLNIILIILLPVVLTIASIIFFNGFGVTNVKLGVYNLDDSPLSQFTIKLVMSFFNGGTLTYVDKNYTEKLQSGELNAVMIIPENFTDALYNGQRVDIDFIPSPVDLQLSVGIYNVLNSIFNDLSGSPFFNPQVLRYLFVSQETPAPRFVPKTKNFKTDFGTLFSPAILFLSVIFLIIAIGVLTIINDRELGLINIFKVNNEKWYKYTVVKFLALFFLGIVVSIGVYVAGITLNIKIPFSIFFPLSLTAIIFHSSLALLISSISPNKAMANIIGISLSMFFFFASGSITPVTTLPKLMFKVASYTPSYKLTYALRNYQLNGIPINSELLYLTLISVVSFLVMMLTIKKEFRMK
ncbi:ABC transporter [Thermosipho melanesiensis]|uniref:ABC-2 type transporter n=2 Tax=Thermosipho melanesiensis TaxID=46541 RepID=A6LK00_THEM4|nr:ABC transporter permease [Thermosipho melanesiensis]ABR30251.1 ABC-2 type transporter [Thermosipho melanesiensis BI429]APT73439.1 ABC transporter [Thermosipho melanesiensis]OOC37382.1 ABC transporter [Thermosipho melanesiensis]OOC39744.1 ABC transporter [Thermosipho melanesiensis]OOC39849.1 ABC transporter [Thermosipho melanesiensis]